MFLRERQNKIAERILHTGRVTVSDLAQEFSVSKDCIRKDLADLEAQNKLQRVYGGAISPNTTFEPRVIKRIAKNTEEKKIIAKKAFGTIQPNETIFLDISSTNVALAELISSSSVPLTIVSNMIEIIRICSACPFLRSIGIGGLASQELDGYVGSAAIAQISALRFDRAYLGARSLTLDSGSAFTSDIDDAQTKKAILACAKQNYLVLDAHKFVETTKDSSGNYIFATVHDLTAVISDATEADLKQKIAALGSSLM